MLYPVIGAIQVRRPGLTDEASEYIIKSVREVVEHLRSFSPVWRDLCAGKSEFILP